MTSPDPDNVKVTSESATIINAFKCLKIFSVLQSFAISTAARRSWAGYSSNFFSKSSVKVIPSAAAPANPHMTLKISETF